MTDRARDTVQAPPAPTHSPRSAGSKLGSLEPASILALQRTAGNAAVVRMLARDGAELERLSLTDLKFACFFIPRSDPRVGRPLRKLLQLSRSGHELVEASSLEEAIERISSRVAHRKDVRISEIVLVAHGRPDGRIDTPVRRGGDDVTPDTLIGLQADFRAGRHKRYQQARSRVIDLLDERSDVIVRGCRAGLNHALTLGLVAFFGGQATVYLPTVFYGVDELTIGGPLLHDEVAAYDFLESKGFIPYGEASEDAAKKAWVRRHLPDRRLPEAYLLDVTDEEKKRLKATHRADDPEIQALKDYEGAQMIGIDKWDEGRYDEQGRDDEMEDLATPELEASAGSHLAALRGLRERSPDDWKAIGREAWLVLRAHRVWASRGAALVPGRDPVAGLTIPGLSYDTNELAMMAARRGDLRIAHHDAFYTAKLETSEAPIDMGAPAETAAFEAPAAAPASSVVVFEDDRITAAPPRPTFPEVSLDLGGEERKPRSLGAAVAPSVATYTIPLATNEVKIGDFLTFKGGFVEIQGIVSGGVGGDRTIVIAGLFDAAPGSRNLGGIGALVKLGEARPFDGSFYLTHKAGLVSEWNAENKGWHEVRLELEWGWLPSGKAGLGGYGHVRVFCAYNSISGELRIGGVRVVPFGLQGEWPVTFKDGSAASIKGVIKPTLDFQPNWAGIAKALGLRLAGAAVTTETVAVGLAAVGAAELAILTGAAAGIGVTIGTHVMEMKDWQDIKDVRPAAEAASADVRAGFVSAFGLSDPGTGPFFAKGAELGRTMSRKYAERMVKGWQSRNPGQPVPFTVEQAEEQTRAAIAQSPEHARMLRSYASGAFDRWIRAEFFRAWARQHPGDRNDMKARAYILGRNMDAPPEQPDFTFVPRLTY